MTSKNHSKMGSRFTAESTLDHMGVVANKDMEEGGGSNFGVCIGDEESASFRREVRDAAGIVRMALLLDVHQKQESA